MNESSVIRSWETLPWARASVQQTGIPRQLEEKKNFSSRQHDSPASPRHANVGAGPNAIFTGPPRCCPPYTHRDPSASSLMWWMTRCALRHAQTGAWEKLLCQEWVQHSPLSQTSLVLQEWKALRTRSCRNFGLVSGMTLLVETSFALCSWLDRDCPGRGSFF